jgi:CO/xanthine dehydrogenase FAD-binding subunit
MAAGYLDLVDGRITTARIAIGACSPVARRLPTLEMALRGRLPSEDLASLVAVDHIADLAPIDDVRASADYRTEAAVTVLRRLLAELAP